MNVIQCEYLRMSAEILLRILPDLRSKYSVLVDGERLGDMETLEHAVLVRDCLADHENARQSGRKVLRLKQEAWALF